MQEKQWRIQQDLFFSKVMKWPWVFISLLRCQTQLLSESHLAFLPSTFPTLSFIALQCSQQVHFTPLFTNPSTQLINAQHNATISDTARIQVLILLSVTITLSMETTILREVCSRAGEARNTAGKLCWQLPTPQFYSTCRSAAVLCNLNTLRGKELSEKTHE